MSGYRRTCLGLACPEGTAAQSPSCSDPVYANYELRFDPGGVEHTARLRVTGCRGTMEVQFVESRTGRLQRVT